MKNEFVFIGCRFGSESLCKEEIARHFDNLRLSFSRPGFLTFKVTGGKIDHSQFQKLVFVRNHGSSLGQLDLSAGDWSDQLKNLTSELPELHQPQVIHVWDRMIGEGDERLIQFLKSSRDNIELIPDSLRSFYSTSVFNRRAAMNEPVLNLIKLDDQRYWVGTHTPRSPHQQFSAGIPPFDIPETIVSRAFYKTSEAIRWSRFPFQENDTTVEIGAAPGGSAQAQLQAGLQVLGIDPAEMNESIKENPRFRHIRKRASEVKKKELADALWLFADSNVAPSYTLDSIEGIVTNRSVQIQGMLITLKLLQESLARELDVFQERIRSWGYRYVRARQLGFNRNEICIAALRRKSLLRFGKVRAS